MLNTRNRVETAIVYLAIFLLFATTVWLAARWPSPGAVLANVLASDAARDVDRFQVLLGMIGAAVIVSIAYLLNGSRQRENLRHIDEAGARGIAHAMALEAADLAETCDRHAVRINGLVGASELPGGELLKLQETDKLLSLTEAMSLVSLDHDQLAKLGRNAHAGANQVRQSVRSVELAIAGLDDGDQQPAGVAGELRELALAYARVARVAEANQILFETLYRRGIATAEERTLPEVISRAEAARHLRCLTEGASAAKPAAIPIRAAG